MKLKKPIKVLLFLFIIVITIYTLITISFKNKNLQNNTTKKETTTKETTTKKEINEVKLTLVGDFLFESPLYKDFEQNGYNNYFKEVKDIFKNDDLSIGNMEVVIGNKDMLVSGDGYNFSAPPSIGNLVSTLDLEVLSTANNHSYDRLKEGVDSTIDYFKNNTDIMTVGTNKTPNKEEKILEINNIKFGFLAYTMGTNIKIDKEHKYSVNVYRDSLTKSTEEYKKIIKEEVKNLKAKTDVIIVLMHWGKEFTYKPNQEQIDMANFLNSIGVDIIYGSHSHCMQPIKEINKDYKTLVYYSLGNFVSADEDISRAGLEFDKSYNVGLISTLNVIKENNTISIKNIKATPVINYYDTNLKHFKLIPYDKYTDDLITTHYHYKNNFNKEYINNLFNKVIEQKYHK